MKFLKIGFYEASALVPQTPPEIPQTCVQLGVNLDCGFAMQICS